MAFEQVNGKSTFMLQVKSLGPLQRSIFMAQILLRVLAIAFTLAAISVMVTSSQTIVLFGFNLSAHYSDSSSLKFLLGADAVVCGFSVLSLIFVCLLSRSGSHVKDYFLLFLHDVVIMVLMISGCAAGTAVGYVSKFGEAKMGWIAVCDHVSKFCNKMSISLGLSYFAFFSYLSLTILSAKKLMSQATE